MWFTDLNQGIYVELYRQKKEQPRVCRYGRLATLVFRDGRTESCDGLYGLNATSF